ncbi:hypothetical protein ACFLQ5_02280 [Bacteroidota bacterium]
MKVKILVLLALSIFLTACNSKYYEYELINKSSEIVSVKIITTGDPYLPILEYTVDPEQKERIFEFEAYGEYAQEETLKPMQEQCKFIKSLEITNSKGILSKKDFNCKDCYHFEVFNGRLVQALKHN